MGRMRLYALLLWLCLLMVAVTGGKKKKDEKPPPQGPFKNQPLSTARGFGKRAVSDFAPLDSSQFVVRDREIKLLPPDGYRITGKNIIDHTGRT